MKKNYKIEVDCANCANLVETAVNKVAGVKKATISFITQKMKVEFEDNADCDAVLAEMVRVGKKIEPDFCVVE